MAKNAEIASVNPKVTGELKQTFDLLKTDLKGAVGDLQRIVKGETEAQHQDNAYIIDELKKICTDFENQSSIKLDFNCACDSLQLIDPKNLWHFQCILEECLNNVRKHSQATQVDIDIAKENGSIILQVKDIGVGLNKMSNGKSQISNVEHRDSGMGLSGMQKRTQKINGTVTLSPNNGAGTKVTFKIPFN